MITQAPYFKIGPTSRATLRVRVMPLEISVRGSGK